MHRDGSLWERARGSGRIETKVRSEPASMQWPSRRLRIASTALSARRWLDGITIRAEDQERRRTASGGRRGGGRVDHRPPSGWTQSAAGGAGPGAIAADIGTAKQSRNVEAAEQAGFQIASPMALAVTQRRLLSLKIGSPIGLGIGGAVKELVSAVPATEVDSIEVNRLAMGKTITLTVRGTPFTLEANAAADANGLADALERAKAGG
jgi:hypothetical protein